MSRLIKIGARTGLLMLLAISLSASVYAQRTVTGKVTDANSGEALIGANVLLKGTSTGTTTDLDGNYELKLAVNEGTLVFTYTGFTTLEIELGDSDVIDAALSSGELLDEIVVVGYGAVKKSDLTGAVASIGERDFNQGVFTAPDQLIQGKAAGVQIINTSGAPGAETTVRIRGNNSIRAGNSPLFVVDGIPLDGRSARPGVTAGDLGATPNANPLNFLNPSDIESIQVLKDASATAIYGSRGANGVVIITTKRAKTGDPSINFSSSVGVSSLLRSYDVLDANEYRNALNQYGIAGGDGGSDVNAMDEITRTGITQNYSFSIGGGNDNGNYRVSAGYQNIEGIIDETGLKKYTGSLSGSYSFFDSKALKIDFNLLSSHITEDIAPISTNAGFTGSLISQAIQWNPTVALVNADGSLNIEKGSSQINPVAMIAAYDDNSELTNVLGSISPTLKITDNLEYRYLFSINHGVGYRRAQMARWINVQNVEDRGWAYFGNNVLTTLQHTHTLTYNEDISDAISLNAVVGYEYQNFKNKGVNLTAQDFIVDDFDYTNILQNSTTGSRILGSFADPTTELQSYFGRVNLNYMDKLLLTATVRADGSSKFGENNKYGVFPSLAAAYNIGDVLVFDDLKVRVGWGKTGNQEFPAGAAQERYSFGQGTIALQNVANPDLKWETATTINFGVDFSLFNYRLTGSIDYFNSVRTDMLFNFTTIRPAPAARYWVNLDGEVINQGVELALNAFIIDSRDLSWSLGGNLTFLQNELRNYEGPTVNTGAVFGQGLTGAFVQRLENGMPLHSFYVREFLGLDDSGQSVYTDDGNSSYFIGDPNPDVLLGLNTALQYKDFSFGMNLQGAFGHQLYNNTKNAVLPIGNLGSRNIDASLLDGDLMEATSNPVTTSSRYLEDGDYLRLANMTLSYNLGNVGNNVKNLRVSLTGQNLLLFTNYSGFDPEVNTVNELDGVPSFGIEYVPYPTARTIILGVNFSF